MRRPSPRSLAVAALLTVLSAYGPISTDVYLPSLPDMMRVFNASVSDVQMTLSVFITGLAAGMLVHGPLSDRYGRRSVLLIGGVIYCLGSLACLFAPSIGWLIAGRFVQAIGACAGPVVARAVVRDVYDRQDAARLMSYMASAVALAPAIGPLIGGWLHSAFGWQANFVAMVIFGVVVLLASALLLEETNRQRGQQSIHPGRQLLSYGRLLRSPLFLGYGLVIGFTFSGLFSFVSGAAFVVITLLGVSEHHFGLVFACVIAGFMSGAFTSGRLSHRLGLQRTIAIGCVGLVLFGACGALLAAVDATHAPGLWGLASVVAPTAGYFFCSALVLPNSTASAMVPYGAVAGAASALLGFVQMAIGAIAGVIVGLLFSTSALPLMAQIAVCGMLALVAFFGLVHRHEKTV